MGKHNGSINELGNEQYNTPEAYMNIERMEEICRENGGNYSMPLTDNGFPNLSLAEEYIKQNYERYARKQRERILDAAFAAYEIGYKLYDGVEFPHKAETFKDKYTWVKSLSGLAKRMPPDEREINHNVKSLINNVKGHIRQIEGGEWLYSPFVVDGVQQVVTDYMQERLERVLSQLLEYQEGGETLEPIRALVTETVKASSVLSCIPANYTQGDFDTGVCDKLATTSFGMGEECLVLRKVGDWALVTWWGRIGFVPVECLTYNVDEIEGMERLYYAGRGPQAVGLKDGRDVMIFPGDRVVRIEDELRVLRGGLGEDRGIDNLLVEMEYLDIAGKEFVEEIKTPADFLNYLCRQNVPYMSPQYDCSEFLRRGFVMAGFPNTKRYSGDMVEDLASVSEKIGVRKSEEFDELKEGVYLVELCDTDEAGNTINSRHVFVAVKDESDLRAYNQAFAIHTARGVEVPVGFHKASKEDLAAQLEMKRALNFVKIAEVVE